MSSDPFRPFVPLGMNSPQGTAEVSSYFEQLQARSAGRGSVPLGMNSAVGEAEWNTFLRRRQQLINDGMQALGLTQQISSGTGAPPAAAFQASSLLVSQQPGSYVQQSQPRSPSSQYEYNRLLGAAQYYGIEGAETMDPSQLAQAVEEFRSYIADRRTGDGKGIGEEVYNTFATFLGTAGLGSVDALVNGLKHVPFVGDAIGKSRAVQSYQRGLAMLEEGFTADMLDNERAAYEKYARPLSHFLGYSALVGTASEAVGTTGFARGISNPLVRGALQGGATGWLVEGGGEDPINERALKIAAFAGFSAAVEWGLPKLMGRLSRSFPRWGDPLYGETPPRPVGYQAPVVDAEWQFVDEAVGEIGAGQRLLSAGPRNLPAGAYEAGPVPPRPLGSGPAPTVDRWGGEITPPIQVGAGMTSFPRPMGAPFEPYRAPVVLTADEAIVDAVNATKQGTILESPAVPAFARQPLLEDADVAIAAMATNPGQISIVQDVGDAAKTIRRFLQETIPNGVGPQDFRAVQRIIPVSVRAGDLHPAGAHFATPGFSTYYDLENAAASFYDTSAARILDLSDPAQATSILQEAIQLYASEPAYVARAQEALSQANTGLSYMEVEELGLADIAKRQGYDGVRFFENDDVAGASTLNIWNYDRVRGVPKTAVDEEGILTRTDILVADGRAITNRMVKEYEQFGMFSGQQATTVTGQQVTISQIGEAFSTVRMIGGQEVVVPTGSLLPGKASALADVAPEAYLEMQSYALSRMADEALHTGLPVSTIDWFSEELASQLPRYIEEFLDVVGVEGTALRGVYTSAFTEMRLRDFRVLAPEEFALSDQIQRAAAEEFSKQVVSGARSLSLEEVAESKGLSWAASPNQLGGTLRDLISGEEVAFDSGASAFEYLYRFNRELPDYSLFSVAPSELAAGPAGTANPGSSLAPQHHLATEEIVANGHRTIDRLLGGGSGGIPPIGPPPGASGEFPPFEGPSLLPGTSTTLGEQFASTDYSGLLSKFDGLVLKLFEPMRNWSLRVEQVLHEGGITEGKMWQHYSDVVNARAVSHNEAVPWHREINEALAMIRRRFIRDGTVTVMGELPRDQALAAMQNAGYTAREVEGQMRLRDILENLRVEYGVGQIMDYMPHLRARAMRGEDLGDLNRMFGGTGRFFAEQVRSGALDVREMNASILLHRWVRAATFHRYAAEPVETMRAAWVADPRVPLSLREIVSDWLDLVVTGHSPGQDILVPGVRHTLNAVGIPVSNAEVARGINFMMTNLYRGALGGRPDVIMRDLIGPLFGATKTGFGPVAQSYMQFFRGGEGRQEMIDLALRGGWLERGMVPMGASEMFQTQMGMVPGLPTTETSFSSGQELVREGAARVGDAMRDALPEGLRSGIQGTWADPLRFYQKEGEFNRLISGHTGYRLMSDALEAFDTARVTAPDVELQPLLGQLMRQSGADAYAAPIQRRIAELATSRQYEEAAFVFANEVANSQFRYGTAEQSLAIRSSGAIGRFGSTFGTFTTQYIAQMKEGVLNTGLAPEFGGTSVDRVVSGTKFLARQAAVAAALGLAGGYTGWNLGKWYWHGSLGFGGGPMLVAVVMKLQQATGEFNAAQGEPLSPAQKAALTQSHDPRGFFSPSSLNPYAGTFRTLQGTINAAESANPWEQTAQFLVTGKRNAADATRFFNEAPFEIGPPPPWVQPVAPVGGGAIQ